MMRPARPAARPAGIHALACSCLCLIAGGCAEIPRAPPNPPPSFPPPERRAPLEIGVLVAGWHSGLVLPRHELGPLAPLLANGSHARYLSFGWGNRRFYRAAHPGSGDALAALFRSPSALFVQQASAPAQLLEADARIHWLCADREELWRVDSYVHEALSRAGGRLIDLGGGPLPGSRFYASRGHYSLVHTCNTWTVAALQYAGLPVRAAGVIFASQAEARVRALRVCPAPQ
jgi:hypothetical protein